MHAASKRQFDNLHTGAVGGGSHLGGDAGLKIAIQNQAIHFELRGAVGKIQDIRIWMDNSEGGDSARGGFRYQIRIPVCTL
jgi:hypothetical protein